MASGSQNMTTYNARIVTGSNSAASPEGALLLSGAGRADDATGDTWIFLDSNGGLTNPWGIKHNQANNKLQIFGSGTNSFSVRMDTGDTYILGKVGIGYDPETSGNTYKLYVDGSTRINSTLHIFPNSENYTEGIRIHSYNSWSDIILCGNDNTGDNNISANSWFIGNNNGNFYISRNGSPGSTAWLECVNNIWSTMNPLWIKGGSTEAGADANRLTTTSGMPGNMQYNTNRRGTQIYSNGIAFADPYNGNTNNDAGWIRHQETTGDVGELEIAVGDDGDETVVVRQYNTSNGVKRTLTLLSKDGYTFLPSYLNLGGGHEKNASSPTYVWGSNSSDNYLRSYQTSHLSVGRAAADANGYNLNDTYRKEYIQVVDLTSFNASTWYPVTIQLPYNGLRRVGVITELNSGHKPSWSSHQSGYTAVVEVLTEAGGWGTTNMWSILLIDQQGFLASGQARPVGYSQFSNSSRATFWCRGGAKYRMYSDFFGGWTVYTSSTTVSSQTIAPTTSYPGVSTTIKLLDASGYSHFSRAYNAVWNDYAEFRIAESEEPGYVVIPSNDGIARLTTERLQSGGRIISDTYGHAVGQSDQAKTPIGLAGRVLAYPYRDKSEYKIGDAVCSAPGGMVDIMTREEIMTYPDRIVGIVNEIPDYEVWEQTFSEQSDSQTAQKIEVKGRIWIDIR